MRVMISINTSWNLYNFRVGLIRALLARGHEIVAIAPRDPFSERLVDLGCRFISLRMDNQGTSPARDLVLLARFWRIMQRERPDVFLGYTIKPNVFGTLAAAWSGVPAINNISGLGTTFIRNTWLTRIVKILYRAALGRSHTVFFQNADDRAVFVDAGLVDAERTALLPGSGIDLAEFVPPLVPPPRDGAPVFLLVARLLWDKGVGEFVQAARRVRAVVPESRFQLLGFLDVENRTAITRDVVENWQSEGIVDYLGATEDVRPFLAAADCVVLPSYREGTPRTLLEAAAMARPLIATDVPGCREVVEDGRNGFLCAVRSSVDLADKMIAFARLPPTERARMGRAGREKVEREFDQAIVIQRYLDVLDGLSGGSRVSAPLSVAPMRGRTAS